MRTKDVLTKQTTNHANRYKNVHELRSQLSQHEVEDAGKLKLRSELVGGAETFVECNYYFPNINSQTLKMEKSSKNNMEMFTS